MRAALGRGGGAYHPPSAQISPSPHEATPRPSPGAGSDVEVTEDLVSLLELLARQKAELRSSQEKTEARRIGLLRKEEGAERGRHTVRDVWKRPSSHGRAFGEIGLLPVKSLTPFEQMASSRPSRSYERAPDPIKGPFRDTGTHPRLFPEPKFVRDYSSGPQPAMNSSMKDTNTLHRDDDSREVSPQASPRNAEVASKPWLPTYGSPRELDKINFVAERLGRFPGVLEKEHRKAGHRSSTHERRSSIQHRSDQPILARAEMSAKV